ncbi:hypothetical protein [Maricaulis sp.]|uniref:hypothetical protein n=1 Tax=Maricaulis sp. TaxID=1486257 RepID=UPI001B169327|nr:hypothetical protein [Maricaulis sp.]MBO6797835.1 hypothetical protein [Maricaulis sp.]
MNIRHILTAGGLAVLTLGSSAGAQVIGGDLNINGSSDDVHFFGGQMRINGEIDGDIFAISGDGEIDATVNGNLEVFGGDLELHGLVMGDVDLAGGDIEVTAEIRETINVGGGSLQISGPVHGELNAAGGSVEIGSTVGDDAHIAGGYIRLTDASSIAGKAEIIGAEVHMDGRFEGRISIEAEEVVLSGRFLDEVEILAEDVRVAAGAEFSAPLRVRGPSEPVIEAGAVVPDDSYEEEGFNFGARHWNKVDFQIDGPVRLMGSPEKFFGATFYGLSFLLGVFAVLLTPRGVGKIARTFRSRPIASMVLGFVAIPMSIVAMVMLTVLLAITIIGIPLILLVWPLYPWVMLLGFAFGGIVIGDLIFNRSHAERGLGLAMRSLSLLLVLVALFALSQVGAIGIPVAFLTWAAGLGAWMLSFGNKNQDETSQRSEPPRRDPEPEIEAEPDPA